MAPRLAAGHGRFVHDLPGSSSPAWQDVEVAARDEPMPARDVHHWIDRWERTGLVDDATAQVLHADAARAGVGRAVESEGGVEAVLSAARGGVVEALGYVGAALTLGAVGVLLDVGSWSGPVLAGALLVTAAVGVAGTYRLTPASSPTTRRLAGVLGAVAVAAVAAAAWQWFAPDPGQAFPDRPGRELVVALPALAVAIVVYLRHQHLLTHAALGGTVVATCVAVGDLVAGRSASFDTRQAVGGILLLVVSLAWMVACETGRLEPAWLGTPVAGAVAYAGVDMATSWSGSDDASVLVALVLAAVATAVGVATSRLRVTIVGAAGLLVAVPMAFTDVLEWSGSATAAVLLPVGVVVTAWAVLASRRPAGRA